MTGTLRLIAADIKIAHSVFALPFAVLGAFMAAAPAGSAIDWRRFGGQLVLIVVAMVLARTVAMLANRLVDRSIDARNPRTAGRALPSGRLSTGRALGVLLACAVGFELVCAGFGVLWGNWWPAVLGLPVLAWISTYGYFKRFTALCHLYLGSGLAISPIAAAIAVDPAALAQPTLWLLALVVMCWVAGFDVIYALQDVDVDRAEGLFSLPARLGLRRALWISRGLHAVAAGGLVAIAARDPRLGAIFAATVGVVVLLLIYEQSTVARWGTSRIALTFFTLNGMISCLLGLAGVVDLLST
jgi:4-hydroxybenzoate polyprenyltransferase